MKKLFSSLVTLVLAISTLMTLAPSASALDIVLSPPKFEFIVNPGETVKDVIKLTNTGDTEINLIPSTQDFVAAGETGKPGFIDPAENDASISVASWITANDNESFILKPGAKKEIPFTVEIPENAEPGGHYGVVFFSPPSAGGQVAIEQKFGALVLVQVTGDIKEEGRLDTFGIYPEDIKGEDLASTSSSSFFSKLPVPFAIRYENTGNIHIKPQGKIEIYNTFGSQVESVGVEKILSPKGVTIEEKIVDYLPVNDMKGNVLSKSFRTFRSTWEGTPYWYYNEDGTKEIRYKGYPVGIYKAKLTLTDAGGKTTIEEVSFIIFPWKEILGGAAGAALLIFLLIKYRRWSNKRREEKFKKQFGIKK